MRVTAARDAANHLSTEPPRRSPESPCGAGPKTGRRGRSRGKRRACGRVAREEAKIGPIYLSGSRLLGRERERRRRSCWGVCERRGRRERDVLAVKKGESEERETEEKGKWGFSPSRLLGTWQLSPTLSLFLSLLIYLQRKLSN